MAPKVEGLGTLLVIKSIGVRFRNLWPPEAEVSTLKSSVVLGLRVRGLGV